MRTRIEKTLIEITVQLVVLAITCALIHYMEPTLSTFYVGLYGMITCNMTWVTRAILEINESLKRRDK